jgi:hypothetical protein
VNDTSDEENAFKRVCDRLQYVQSLAEAKEFFKAIVA